MKPTSAMEDYLEALLSLEAKGIETRVKNLAEELNIKPPSVIEMLKHLIAKGYVTQENRKEVHLTESGMAVAKKIQKKHAVIKSFLVDVLKLDEDTADTDACKIEHCLSQKTYEQLMKFMGSSVFL
jgi:DtxR family Mn-dependent transcriptional regulator